uniref:Shn zinc finger protein n=1 Tax=Hirondellea gigas TaxID=1518452 RepID=A0A6A7G4T3_9CRUS
MECAKTCESNTATTSTSTGSTINVQERGDSSASVVESSTEILDMGEEKDEDIGAANDEQRVKIFDGGFKSTEDYTYVRGRGRGRYVCETCGIRCKKPSMLKKHIRTHTNLRPYPCRHCTSRFKTKGNLTKHLKSKAHYKRCLQLGVPTDPASACPDFMDSEDHLDEDTGDDDDEDDDADDDDDDDDDECDDGRDSVEKIGDLRLDDSSCSDTAIATDNITSTVTPGIIDKNSSSDNNTVNYSTNIATNIINNNINDTINNNNSSQENNAIDIKCIHDNVNMSSSGSDKSRNDDSNNHSSDIAKSEAPRDSTSLSVSPVATDLRIGANITDAVPVVGLPPTGSLQPPSICLDAPMDLSVKKPQASLPSSSSCEVTYSVGKLSVSSTLSYQSLTVPRPLYLSLTASTPENKLSSPMPLRSPLTPIREQPEDILSPVTESSVLLKCIYNTTERASKVSAALNINNNQSQILSQEQSGTMMTAYLTEKAIHDTSIKRQQYQATGSCLSTASGTLDDARYVVPCRTVSPQIIVPQHSGYGRHLTVCPIQQKSPLVHRSETNFVEKGTPIQEKKLDNVKSASDLTTDIKKFITTDNNDNRTHGSLKPKSYYCGKWQSSKPSLEQSESITTLSSSIEVNRLSSPNTCQVKFNPGIREHHVTTTPVSMSSYTSKFKSHTTDTIDILNSSDKAPIEIECSESVQHSHISDRNVKYKCIVPPYVPVSNSRIVPPPYVPVSTSRSSLVNVSPIISVSGTNSVVASQSMAVASASLITVSEKDAIIKTPGLPVASNAGGESIQAQSVVAGYSNPVTVRPIPKMTLIKTSSGTIIAVSDVPSVDDHSSRIVVPITQNNISFNSNSGSIQSNNCSNIRQLSYLKIQTSSFAISDSINNPIPTISNLNVIDGNIANSLSSSVTNSINKPTTVAVFSAKPIVFTSNNNIVSGPSTGPMLSPRNINSPSKLTTMDATKTSSPGTILTQEKGGIASQIISNVSTFTTVITPSSTLTNIVNLSAVAARNSTRTSPVVGHVSTVLTPSIGVPSSGIRSAGPSSAVNLTVLNSSDSKSGTSFLSPSGVVPTSANSRIGPEDGRCRCYLCHKEFSRPSQLNLHMNIHYMERPFRCAACAVSFRTSGHLQKHKRSASHFNKVNMNLTFGAASTSNPRPFKCHDCKIAFRIHGHLAKHLRSKMHIQRLECLSKLPFGVYAEMERTGSTLANIDTTDCENALISLQALASKLFAKEPGKLLAWQNGATGELLDDSSRTRTVSNSSANSDDYPLADDQDDPPLLDSGDETDVSPSSVGGSRPVAESGTTPASPIQPSPSSPAPTTIATHKTKQNPSSTVHPASTLNKTQLNTLSLTTTTVESLSTPSSSLLMIATVESSSASSAAPPTSSLLLSSAVSLVVSSLSLNHKQSPHYSTPPPVPSSRLSSPPPKSVSASTTKRTVSTGDPNSDDRATNKSSTLSPSASLLTSSSEATNTTSSGSSIQNEARR